MSNEKSKEVPAPAAPEPEYAAFVALDWADQKHDWQMVAAGSQKREKGEFDNTPEAVMAWVANLSERFGSRPIAVSLEQSRGSLVYMLLKFPKLVLFPVHPNTAAHFREASSRRAPRATPAMPGCCCRSCCSIGTGYGACSRIPPRRACCSAWWNSGGRW